MGRRWSPTDPDAHRLELTLGRISGSDSIYTSNFICGSITYYALNETLAQPQEVLETLALTVFQLYFTIVLSVVYTTEEMQNNINNRYFQVYAKSVAIEFYNNEFSNDG